MVAARAMAALVPEADSVPVATATPSIPGDAAGGVSASLTVVLLSTSCKRRKIVVMGTAWVAGRSQPSNKREAMVVNETVLMIGVKLIDVVEI